MQIKNSYFWFKEALKPDECQRIIEQGNRQKKNLKKPEEMFQQLPMAIIINKD